MVAEYVGPSPLPQPIQPTCSLFRYKVITNGGKVMEVLYYCVKIGDGGVVLEEGRKYPDNVMDEGTFDGLLKVTVGTTALPPVK